MGQSMQRNLLKEKLKGCKFYKDLMYVERNRLLNLLNK